MKPPKDEFCLDCHEAETVTELELLRKQFDSGIHKSGKTRTDAQRLVDADGGRAVHNPVLAKKVMQ